MTGNEGFFAQFLEDYFAECEEHLGAARRVMLVLEGSAGGAPADPGLLRELFRSLHTLKGLAGMVGDSGAERIAHAAEGALRAAGQDGRRLVPALVDALFASLDMLERCVAARRSEAAPPDIAPVLAQLARALGDTTEPAIIPTAAPSSGPAAAASATVVAGPNAGNVTHFEFAPSVALAGRGVGVDAIRERLRSLGRLLDAKPRMMEAGLVFDFWIEADPGRVPDPAWAADGLRWTAERAGDAQRGDADRADSAADGAEVEVPAESPVAASVAEAWVPSAGTSVARVDLTRLDAVMRLVGDLVVSRSRLDDVLRQLPGTESRAARDALEETSAAMERQLRQLRERVMRIRLVPVGEVFERLRFAARDAIRESGKRVALAFQGQATEIDKLVVDRMLEPLLHLVRNAVSHGIEAPDDRLAVGKPVDGTLTLRAAASGDRILIEVEDDGGGIDVRRVAERARARGLLADHAPLADDALLDVLCAPGFSTRDEADLTSGRGVGMDVVRTAVHALGGELSVSSVAGAGTRFLIDLPLTLMIVDALMVEVGGQEMAVPQPALREVLQVDSSAIVRFENNDIVSYRGAALPVVRLARLFGLAEAERASVYLLVVGTESAPMGLMVDRLLGLREIVVHPVTDPLVAVPGVAGATELGDGRVSLILDAAALLRLAHDQRGERPVARRAPALRARPVRASSLAP